MDFISVSSKSASAVAYDETSNTLGVRYLNGSEYHYFGVPKSVYEGLLSASSVGQFLDQHVKKAGYSFSRVA